MTKNIESKLAKNNAPISTMMGFDFYGSGNIGDDLMVSGFQQALLILHSGILPKVYAKSKWNLESQKLRFPDINWLPSSQSFNSNTVNIPETECWAGVGDTPFQLTCGNWFLDFLLSERGKISHFKHKVLVGVGCETEIQDKQKEFSLIADVFDRISVRDEHSYHILVDLLKVSSQKVFIGSDLANISLPIILGEPNIQSRQFKLGLILAGDTFSKKDIQEVAEFLAQQENTTAFIAGETRKLKNSELDIFANLTKFPWSKLRSKIVLKVPNYSQGSLYDLVQPVCACETVISSRYHGLLAAAWAGCKVAAIGRSSKVSALAKELNIPYCSLPITRNKLDSLLKEASKVSNTILMTQKEKALAGVDFTLN